MAAMTTAVSTVDDDDFTASLMCCACGGGYTAAPAVPPALPPPLAPLTLAERYGHNQSWCVTPLPLVSSSLASPAVDVPAGYVSLPEDMHLETALDLVDGACTRPAAAETHTQHNLSLSQAYSLFPGVLAPDLSPTGACDGVCHQRSSRVHGSIGTPLALQLTVQGSDPCSASAVYPLPSWEAVQAGDARNALCAGGGARAIQLSTEQPVSMEIVVRYMHYN